MKELTFFCRKHSAACLVMAAFFVISLFIFNDYGIAWDEPLQREIGKRSWDYVRGYDKDLNNFNNRDYGVAAELPLTFLEKALQLKDTHDIFLMRHLAVHLFFLFSCFIFYLLIWNLYKNRLLALAGLLMLLLSPRIFAHSFFNSKDIPFLCMYILNFWMMLLAFRSRKIWQFFLLGIFSGLLINIRIMGVIIPAMITFMVLTDLMTGEKKFKTAASFSVYLVAALLALYISWPWLWEEPFKRFSMAFINMSRFRWNNEILFNGSMMHAANTGWTYFPRWFGLTTPIVYLVLGCTGIVFMIVRFFRTPALFLKNNIERNHLIHFLLFIGPVLSILILHSILYDAWRQMYFVYPGFLLMAVFGLHGLLKLPVAEKLPVKMVIIGILAVSFIRPAVFMISCHPHEDVYFNNLLPKKHNYLRTTYEMDYWGTTYRGALEFILENDPSPVVRVKVDNLSGFFNSYILKEDQRKRLQFVELNSQADYFITNYRWHPYDFPFPEEQKIYRVTIDNSEICTAWKFKK